jgi:hypothetical protein
MSWPIPSIVITAATPAEGRPANTSALHIV